MQAHQQATPAYQGFRQALAALTSKAIHSQPHAAISERPSHLEAVDQLQARVLTPVQMDALQQVQDALTAITQLERTVNELLTLQALPLNRISLADGCRAQGDIEHLLFEHALAVAKLRHGTRNSPVSTTQRAAA